MRRTWLTVPALLAGCYLSPSKHDSDEGLINTIGSGASDADGSVQTPVSCILSSSCPASAPLCVDGTCAACTQHADCAGFASTPACGPAGRCVACAADETRACTGASSTCNVATGECIGCSRDADCADSQRAVCNPVSHACEPCTANAQCGHLPGAGMCIQGACAECTSTALELCRESLAGGDIRQFVCDPSTHRCDRTRLANSKDLCEPCISDLECVPGQLCVDVSAGAGSKVCQQIQVPLMSCSRPYGMTSTPITSADGTRANVCGLLVESTTCEAQRQFRNKRCGTPNQDDPTTDRMDTPDDSKCGVANREDGYCVWYAPRRQYLCTTACRNSADDCLPDALGCSMQRHQTGTRNLCTL